MRRTRICAWEAAENLRRDIEETDFGLDYPLTISDVKWTYVSPAAEFEADGIRTGEYILAGEEFTVNSKGESVIRYADYAIAMVDEIEKGNHIRQRISVLGK